MIAPSFGFYAGVAAYLVASGLFFASLVQRKGWLERAAWIALCAGFIFHGVDISMRGSAGLHPGSSLLEAAGFFSWILVGGYLWWSRKAKLTLVGSVIAPVAAGVLILARILPQGTPIDGLTLLGRVHISLAMFAVGLFTLATVVAIFYLLENRQLKEKNFEGFFFKRSIALETLDNLSYRLVLVAFPVFTLSLLLGAIWVSQRDGGFAWQYPLAFLTWIVFGGIIIGRTWRGLRGKPAASLTIIGYSASLAVFGLYVAERFWAG